MEDWLVDNYKSPITATTLAHPVLTPNRALSCEIDDWLSEARKLSSPE
jgi:hypothetical protein